MLWRKRRSPDNPLKSAIWAGKLHSKVAATNDDLAKHLKDVRSLRCVVCCECEPAKNELFLRVDGNKALGAVICSDCLGVVKALGGEKAVDLFVSDVLDGVQEKANASIGGS